jgi:hypothetical protein
MKWTKDMENSQTNKWVPGRRLQIDRNLFMALYQLQQLFCIEWSVYVKIAALDELEWIGKESVVTYRYFKVLSWHLAGETEESYIIQDSRGSPKIRTGQLPAQVGIVAAWASLFGEAISARKTLREVQSET